jgi:hypothetical protein
LNVDVLWKAAVASVDWTGSVHGSSTVTALASKRGAGADDDNDVIRAIKADPNLLPEAKEHFLNQYALLLLVQPREGQRLPYAAHGKRTDPVDPGEEERIEKVARRTKQANPHAPGKSK